MKTKFSDGEETCALALSNDKTAIVKKKKKL